MKKTFQISPILIFFVFIFSLFPAESQAQRSEDFLIANDYLRNGEYEQAYHIFSRLLRENPDSHPIYDRAVTSLINLKRFDEAADLTQQRLNRNPGDIITMVRLGELHHMAGDTARASDTWQQIIARNRDQPQVYRYIAETLNGRREFEKSLAIYYQARKNISNESLFGNEIARSLLVLGRFEEGMQEYIELLSNSPAYTTAIQRQLIQYDDRDLFDAAIITLENATSAMRPNQESFSSMRGLLIWALMERQLYRRALAVARNLERSVNDGSLTVFNLGGRLKNAGQFELATQAFATYLEGDVREYRAMAAEETARLYIEWGGYLIDNNLDFGNRADSMYRTAANTINEYRYDFTQANRRLQMLALQFELALDYQKDAGSAEKHLEDIRSLARSNDDMILADYLEGRIEMFRGNHMQARVFFSRANRAAGTGEMADRTRYYLALNDFYVGDFEYAGLQMRPLQRQSTSLFANNALRLRLWISEGLAADSNATDLRKFSRARHQFSAGNYTGSLTTLLPYLTSTAPMPVKDEAVILASSIIRKTNPELAMSLLSVHIDRGIAWASRERVMWEKARLADLIHRKSSISHVSSEENGMNIDNEILAELARFAEQHGNTTLTGIRGSVTDSSSDSGHLMSGVTVIVDLETVIGYYENMLIEHPTGFYAQVARERISQLNDPGREL